MTLRLLETPMRPILAAAAGLLAVAFSAGVNADSITLKSGVHYNDVKTRPSAGKHTVYFRDGRVLVISNSEIRSVRPNPTTWQKAVRPVPEPKVEIAHPSLHAIMAAGVASRSLPLPNAADNATDKWGPVLRSAVLPGWGQYSSDRPKAGILYASGIALLFQQYWVVRNQHAAAERAYNDPLPVGAVALQSLTGGIGLGEAAAINLTYLAIKERDVFRLQKRGNNLVLLMGLAWSWNMLDIVYGGVPWEADWFGKKDRNAAVWRLQLNRDSFEFSVRVGL